MLGAATSALGGYQNQTTLGGAGAASSLGGLSSLAGLGSLGGLGNLLSATGGGLGGSGSNLSANSLAGLGGNSGLSSTFGLGGNFGSTGANYTAGQQLSNYSITGVGSGGGIASYSTGDNRGRSSASSGSYGMSDSSTTAKTRVFVRNVSITRDISQYIKHPLVVIVFRLLE